MLLTIGIIRRVDHSLQSIACRQTSELRQIDSGSEISDANYFNLQNPTFSHFPTARNSPTSTHDSIATVTSKLAQDRLRENLGPSLKPYNFK